MNNTPLKTAIIGYGFSAKTFHIPFVTSLDNYELLAVSTSKEKELKQDLPDVEHFAQAHDLITNSSAEVVIITSPNDVHFTLAKLALENGKHVIVEKPFVTNCKDGEYLIELAATNKLTLTVYHNRRWDGDFLTVKRMIENKEFGELKHFESHFDRFRPQVRQRWREQSTDGGGILFDLGPHLIDQTLALFGKPEAVSARCHIMREGSNNIDYFDLTLHYPNHDAILHADLFSAGANRRFTIKGTKGGFEKFGLDPQEARLIEGQLPTDAAWADEPEESYGKFYSGTGATIIKTERGGYQDFFNETAEAIRQNQSPPVTAEEALLNIKIIELAIESSRSGKRLKLKRQGI